MDYTKFFPITGMNPKASCGVLNPPLRGIVPHPDILGWDSSSNNFQYATLLKFGTHYDLQISTCDL